MTPLDPQPPSGSTAPPPADPEASRLLEDIKQFLQRITTLDRQPEDETFDRLAQAAFDFQYRRIPAFRRLCDHRRASPDSLTPFDWSKIPPVPVMAFRRQKLHAAEAREVFRSSGTTGGQEQRSVHYHPFPDLYRAVIDATFPQACFPPHHHERRPLLSLVPSRRTISDSSLSFMCDHVLKRFGDPASSTVAMTADGLRVDLANTWCRDLQGRPGTVLTTAFALAFWLDALEQRNLTLDLPDGSTLFETGGFKGRTRELGRDDLLQRIEHRLGLTPDSVVREYGMTELTGHVYTKVLSGGDRDRFIVPPFMKVRMLDPETLEQAPDGRPGLVTFFDLTNFGSAIHVITQDLGIRDIAPDGAEGFRLLGRASDAQLRGCSLTAEELTTPSML